jgi:hypothetical protein
MKYRPLETKIENIFLFFNELTVSLYLYFLIPLSDFNLHTEYFKGEFIDFKVRNQVRDTDLRILFFGEGNDDLSLAKSVLFDLGIPSAEQMRRITKLADTDPQRAKLDNFIRSKLETAPRGGGLSSFRPDDRLSASMELGLSPDFDDIYVAVLFGDKCYKVTPDGSSLSNLKPPQGLFSYRPDSLELKILRDSLPSFHTLLELDGLSGEELRNKMPKFSANLTKLLSASANPSQGRLVLQMETINEGDENSRMELRFETDEDVLLNAFYLVGPPAWHQAPCTRRTWSAKFRQAE